MRERGRVIASRPTYHETPDRLGVSLLFPASALPDARAIRVLAKPADAIAGGGFHISHDPSEPAACAATEAHETSDWLEILADGLTFDLTGLAPGSGHAAPECAYRFDLPSEEAGAELVAIHLMPGPHLIAGARMMPVVRAMAALAAQLCALPGLHAVAWHPARSWLGPRYFSSIIGNWLEGGVFPGLGLVGLASSADGGLQSEGLAFFIGQELRIEPELTENRAAAAKIAVRLIDHLIERDGSELPRQVTGPAGRILQMEPSANGRFIRVWGGI